MIPKRRMQSENLEAFKIFKDTQIKQSETPFVSDIEQSDIADPQPSSVSPVRKTFQPP